MLSLFGILTFIFFVQTMRMNRALQARPLPWQSLCTNRYIWSFNLCSFQSPLYEVVEVKDIHASILCKASGIKRT